jgi:hypothetical protein
MILDLAIVVVVSVLYWLGQLPGQGCWTAMPEQE